MKISWGIRFLWVVGLVLLSFGIAPALGSPSISCVKLLMPDPIPDTRPIPPIHTHLSKKVSAEAYRQGMLELWKTLVRDYALSGYQDNFTSEAFKPFVRDLVDQLGQSRKGWRGFLRRRSIPNFEERSRNLEDRARRMLVLRTAYLDFLRLSREVVELYDPGAPRTPNALEAEVRRVLDHGFFFIPTAREIGIRDFNESLFVPILRVGVLTEKIPADGRFMDPILFFEHDGEHGVDQALSANKNGLSYNVRSSPEISALEGRAQDRIVFLRKIETLKDKKLRDSIHLLIFVLHHEIPELGLEGGRRDGSSPDLKKLAKILATDFYGPTSYRNEADAHSYLQTSLDWIRRNWQE